MDVDMADVSGVMGALSGMLQMPIWPACQCIMANVGGMLLLTARIMCTLHSGPETNPLVSINYQLKWN